MNDVLPNYTKPCISETNNSLESNWLYPSDFGECYPPSSDHQIYPRLIPVYNGKVLDIQTEFVHASLSGISIKHYYGKCTKGEEDGDIGDQQALYSDHRTEGEDYEWFEDDRADNLSSFKNASFNQRDVDQSENENLLSGSTSTGSFEYREEILVEGHPLCTLPNINYRNSFWNIHRPELCKLTWGQQYVGTSLVTEHLHEHLMQHGTLCAGFHTEKDRKFMLNRELDEYVRLKVLEETRKLPPDEPLFDFRPQPQISKVFYNSKCKASATPELKTDINDCDRFLQLSDDEDEINIRRSKEEFCLTIGKHVRRPPVVQPEILVPEGFITPEHSTAVEEEEVEFFYYNWLLYTEEEPYEEDFDNKTESVSMTISEPEPLVEPCPPLMMDEFCRAAGKVNFSDLRCDPDF